MNRIRVAHVIFPRANALRPVPEFSWDAVLQLTEAGDFDVEVLMPLAAGPLRGAQSRSRRLRGATPWPADIEARLLALDPRPTLVRYLPLPRASTESAAAALAFHLLRRPRAARPHVVHGSFLDEGGYCAAFVARWSGAASIAVAHGTDVRAAHGEVAGIGRKRRARATLVRAARLLAVSRHLAARLASLGAHAEFYPVTASAERFPLATRPPDRPPVILYVGRLTRAKGVDLLLEAFARITRRDARLELVGPDPGELDLRADCERLGIAGRVRFIGELAQPALLPHYVAASCLALASRAEGLGCVLAEALLVGRPVVAMDVGGVSELVGRDVGRLVPPGDVAALARALDETLGAAFEPARLRGRVLPFVSERAAATLARVTRSVAERG